MHDAIAWDVGIVTLDPGYVCAAVGMLIVVGWVAGRVYRKQRAVAFVAEVLAEASKTTEVKDLG